jgi:alanine-glyoxylate transaminase/serine-glyoxylate transaminase/serine-pyruvate transaminase
MKEIKIKTKRPKLMIPGPVEMDQETLKEMSSPPRAHYGVEWVESYDEALKLLRRIFQTSDADIFLIPGSGSAGLDASIGSLVGDEVKVLVLSNGFFGERLVDITKSYTDNINVLRTDPRQALSLDRIEDEIKRYEPRVVICVHCETSTGVLNPLKELGEICVKYDAILVVDAISSLGGAELKLDEWNIGVCISASQKCLETPPGLAVVAVSERAWEQINQTKTPGWYLNLRIWKEYLIKWGKWHPTPVTVSTGIVGALRTSLERIIEEGLEERFSRHNQMASFVRQGLLNLGFELFALKDFSPTVTATLIDERISAKELMDFLREKQGIQISGGLEELRGKIFRVGHMGPQASLDSILPLLFGIEEALRHAGAAIETGQSLKQLPQWMK